MFLDCLFTMLPKRPS